MNDSEFGQFSVILPVYNEAENIEKMISTLDGLYPGIRILVMDDNSKDDTIKICRDIESRNERVKLFVRAPEDRGLTASVAEGIVCAETPYFIVMDADFQHPPEILKCIMGELSNGSDLVIGKRTQKNALSTARRIYSDAAQGLAAFYLKFNGQPLSHDIMSGLFGSRTEMCQKIVEKNGENFERPGFKVLFDLLKFIDPDSTVSEVEYMFGNRAGGESKLNGSIIVSVLRQCGKTGGKFAKVAAVIFSKK